MKNKTTILHLTPSLELCNEAREVIDLCIQTHRAKWRPLIASSGGSMVMEAERSAVRHTKIQFKTKSLWFSWRNKCKLEKLINKERPSIIHCHEYEIISVASKIALKKHIPLLIDLKEPCQVTEKGKKILQLAANRGAYFRVPSKYMADFLCNDMKLNTQYLRVITPGINLQWFEAVRVTPERINELHKLWRLPEQSTIIIMATPFATGYGHKILLEALKELKNNDIYAVLIGDDNLSKGMREKIESMVKSYGLEGKVIMPENCTDWPAACWLSSLVVATNSIPRGQAPELLAAQAIGRPVIITDCGANAEMAKHGETAWIIPKEEKAPLVDALQESLSMGAANRIDLAIATRSYVSEYFPMELWRDNMFKFYDLMLSTKYEI